MRPTALLARLEYDPTHDRPATLGLYKSEKDLMDGNDCAIFELTAEQITKLSIDIRMQPFNLDTQEYQE